MNAVLHLIRLLGNRHLFCLMVLAAVILVGENLYQVELLDEGVSLSSPSFFLDRGLWRFRGASGRHRNLRTLVIIIGNLRGGEAAWESLRVNVLEYNRADLALLIGDTRPAYQNSSLFSIAKYRWHVNEYDDWGDVFDMMHRNDKSWREHVFPLIANQSNLLGGISSSPVYIRGSGSVIWAFRFFLSQKIKEHKLTGLYDRFVITRSDHFYRCVHDLSKLDPSVMWVPHGEGYGGYTDRHLIVNQRQVLTALNILPPVLDHPERYKEVLGNREMNPEKFLMYRWNEEALPVKRFKRVMFTCAVPGDTTRYKCMSVKVVEGVYLKYETEYNMSYETCRMPISDHNFISPLQTKNHGNRIALLNGSCAG